MIQDMTKGKPSAVLRRFAIPMLLSVVFQQLYQLADSAIAGKFIGEGALAATGASYPVTMLFIAVAVGANTGCNVVVSQLFGGKRIGEMKTAVYTSFLSACAVSLFLTLLGILFTNPILNLLQTPGEIFHDTTVYLLIYLLGYPFLFLYNISNGSFTALGDSRTPLFFLILSSVSNVVLDLWFVIGFKMGVAGLALATLIAQGIAAVLAALTVFRRLCRLKSEEKSPLFSMEMLKRITRIAIPSIFQQSFISVGNLMIQGLVNSFGQAVIAGYSAAIKLNTFSLTCFNTLSTGLSSFSAQNLGAGEIDRTRQGLRAGIILALIVAIPFMLVFIPFGKSMVTLFLPEESLEAIRCGTTFIRGVAPFYPVILVKILVDGVLRGAGDMRRFMIATFADLFLRVVLCFVLTVPFGFNGIWLSWPIGWVAATVLSCIFYRRGAWRDLGRLR